MEAIVHSKDYERLYMNYYYNFVTKEQLKKYVLIHEKLPDHGITAEEYNKWWANEISNI